MLLPIQDLPNCQSNSDQHAHRDGRKLWLIEEDSTYINPESI
ncbi:12033_t:CDS:1, partial [Cetraspora pellucida]